MPSSQQPSFASAAAGQGPSRDPRGVRGDGRGSGDWARRDNRGPNGTLTLRRSSTTPYAQSSSIEASLPTPIESSQPSTVFESADSPRYSKEQLLNIYKVQKEAGGSGNVSQLLHSDFDPWHTNGTNGRASWGKASDGRDNNYGPAVCWDKDGGNEPLGLQPLSEEEKAAFAGDINSPLKPPPQNANKDGNAPSGTGRKTSVSHGQGNTFNTSSPASSRPGTRRQQTADSISGLNSPLASRFGRDENSPFFRKFGDTKEVAEEPSEGSKPSLPFGGLIRANTAGGPSSPWGAGPTAMSPMGNFGSFPIGQGGVVPPTPTDKRAGFGSIRGESRLAHLMPKESSEDLNTKSAGADKQWRSRPRTDTDPFGDGPVSGSAALGGGQDDSPPQTAKRVPGSDTPVRGTSSEFGLSDAPNFRDSMRAQSHQTPQKGEYDPLSPSNTNPYASPADQNRHDPESGSYDDDHHHVGRTQTLGGIPEHQANMFGGLRTFASGLEGSDRSQTSSVTGSKPMPSLGGLHNLSSIGGGWPTSGNPIGTPDRENRGAFGGAFGSTLFGNNEPVQSPSLGPIGGIFGHGSSSNLAGTAGRGSKLGSLFPAAMQAQMHVPDHEGSDGGDYRQQGAFGAIGRGPFGNRDTDSPIRASRHPFEDLFPPTEASRTPNAFSAVDAAGQTSTAFPQSSTTASNYQQSQGSSEGASSQLPATQQRMMVMPDRMRWVYLDPQGQVQGPWSGLEMHDWYKASFFTADLSVKKVEDAEFEPLGQLIRRIGNSREPFLVPQIGIPHGPAAPAAGAPFPPAAVSGTSQPGSVQPPFAGAFPSFGTTLTAEQQNNLERRKQEEQYLMARQREFLAQQQVNMRQMQTLPSALHHHSSAHSLHSQPSLGSLTSPIGMAQQAHLPGVGGFFDQLPPRQGPNASQPLPTDFFRDDEFARLGLQDRPQPFGAAPQQQSQLPFSSGFPQNIDTSRDTSRNEQDGQDDPQGFKARHEEFLMYQRQMEAEADMDALTGAPSSVISKPIGPPQPQAKQSAAQVLDDPKEKAVKAEPESEVLSMTQQVQNAVSNKEAANVQPESPWAKVEIGLPMPFPPPQSTTPLPAPNPQRSRSNLPEALSAESRSRSETPEITAPSLAPWAKEPAEASRGPSLKEIQEAEARKAALAEQAAIAARRAQAELELKLLTTQITAPAPGLPTSSTWGTTSSPAPTTSSSPWAKPVVIKTQATTASAASKKTLADIQREEENRKQKLAAAVAAAVPPVQGNSAGKRYADLAGKSTASVSPVGATAWNTVGAGGKVKVPTGPTAAPQISRAVSSAAIPSAPSRVTRPVVASRSTSTMISGVANNANDEFNKWAKGELVKGLNPGVDVDSFVELLANFPQDASIIADSVYGSSKLMDGRRFAEEYLRRRKLADKGIVEPAKTGSASGFNGGEKSGGGWSEVAKKGPAKEETSSTAGFKVVPNKKKGKK